MIPFDVLDTLDMASLSIGSKSKTTFQKRLDSYGKIAHFQVDKDVSSKKLLNKLAEKEVVIVSLHDMSSYSSKGYGLTANK